MPEDPRKKRPVPLRLTALMIVLALVQPGMAWRAVSLPAELAAAVLLPLALDFVASGLWALVFGGVAWGLVRSWSQARRYAGFAMIAFALYSLARLILFAQAAYDKQRLPFLGVLVALFIMFVWVTLLRKNGEISDGNNARS